MELRIRKGRAVLAERADEDGSAVEQGQHSLEPDLVAALHEWARVSASVSREGNGPEAPPSETDEDAASMVTRRGHQLAGQVATQLNEAVRVIDPMTGGASVVAPETAPSAAAHSGFLRSVTGFFHKSPGEPTPWGTGLIVSAFVCAVVLAGMLALGGVTSGNSSGWMTALVALLVTGGVAPSLWLGRSVPVLRWVCLGAAAGLAIAWVALLFVMV